MIELMFQNARESLGEIGVYWQTTTNGKNSGISSVTQTGEDAAFDFYVKKIIKKDFDLIVFDVGAAVGEWTRIVNKSLTNSCIYSFEPGEKYHEILKMRCVPSNGNSIKFEKYAVAEITKNAKFYTPKDGQLSHSSLLRGNLENLRGYEINEHEVQCISIQDYLEASKISGIDFLKIDTEGAEFEILSSAIMRNNNIGAIQFEYNDTYLETNIRMQNFWKITEENYYLFRICKKGLIYFGSYDANYMEDMGMQNYILISKDICKKSSVLEGLEGVKDILLFTY